jgi:hypothetical protein
MNRIPMATAKAAKPSVAGRDLVTAVKRGSGV